MICASIKVMNALLRKYYEMNKQKVGLDVEKKRKSQVEDDETDRGEILIVAIAEEPHSEILQGTLSQKICVPRDSSFAWTTSRDWAGNYQGPASSTSHGRCPCFYMLSCLMLR